MKLDCIIIDDEPLARDGLRDYVKKVSLLQLVGEFKNAIEAKAFIEEHPVDLMFLDINMPKINGLNFVRSLEEPPKVIFTTAYREFATESYDLDGIDYLLKPISFERFFKAVNKVLELLQPNIEEGTRDHFFVKVDGTIKRVLNSEVLYIEGMKDYIKIYLANGSTLITLLSLKQMELALPEGFIRVHRSFIVSLRKVGEISGNVLKIAGSDVPMAPNLRAEVMQKVLGDNYLKRN
ncbi:response regulator transcription factor [Roseivirga sp. E12]|uniref:LytR/AlgR family response regulator transcription factor n=1 Tax=Roseivirga sp. E12 TaxID=2819237 RepID=UPI001ABD309F|nr:response regulator transcription factor [Roseivirga sp. E12]